MDIDLGKLGRLIEKCQASGVSRLKIDQVEVTFGESSPPEEKVVQGAAPVEFTPEQIEEIKKAERKEEQDFDDEMLHITDPVAWQKSQLDPEGEPSEAVGGDEREMSYVQ
jgi:hypothetical protein